MASAATSNEEDDEQQAARKFPGTRHRDLDFLHKNGKRQGVVQLESGMQYKVQRSGPSDAPRPLSSTPCRVHYRGMLTDGAEFDSTYRRGHPIILRPEDVVPGWSEALQLMREGDRWEVILPSHLAYGDRGAHPIPGGAVLIFEMELLEVGAREDGNSNRMLVLIGAIIAVGLLIFAYQQLTKSSPRIRGRLMHTEEASDHLNPHVFFDIEIAGKPAGRVEFELFAKVTPKTAENFRALATGEMGVGKSGKKLHYKGSSFHRIIPSFMCQGGDITKGDGRGGESIYGATFEDEWEHGVLHHAEAGLLSMANRGRDTGSSQFFITVAPTPWLDGKHVVFGRVVSGMEVISAMEAVGSKGGRPSEVVVIVDSGELTEDGQPSVNTHSARAAEL